MAGPVNRKQRIVILFEAYVACRGESTVSEFYKWLNENQITGCSIYTSKEIGMIIHTSGKFEKTTKNRWKRRGR